MVLKLLCKERSTEIKSMLKRIMFHTNSVTKTGLQWLQSNLFTEMSWLGSSDLFVYESEEFEHIKMDNLAI